MNKRITKRAIQSVADALSERDIRILQTLGMYRYMNTHHLRRIYFTGYAGELVARRCVNRTLSKLCGHGLIYPLTRRIGGVRAGSGAFVWTLTQAGAKLLAMQSAGEEAVPRKRSYEPSQAFLEHTLAVAETGVRLHEFDGAKKLSLTHISVEPGCWRQYAGAGGEAKTLKPDMAAVTSIGEYEDSWFLELDLATEAPCTVLRKCLQYMAYYKTGSEQHKNGVFPCVVWIVLDKKRQTSIESYLHKNITGTEHGLFTVIVMSELEPLMLLGAQKFKQERTTQ